MNPSLCQLFMQLNPVGQKIRFHLRAGTSFTGTVHSLHKDEDGRLSVIQLVPGHKATGDFMYLNGADVCAIAFVTATSKSRLGHAAHRTGEGSLPVTEP